MRAILAGGFVLAMLATAAAMADDKIDPAKLVGKWKSEEPKSATEFTKDGKFTMVVDVKGKSVQLGGTYKLDGDKLNMKVSVAGKEQELVSTVKKLTDEELVIENQKAKTTTMKRVK